MAVCNVCGSLKAGEEPIGTVTIILLVVGRLPLIIYPFVLIANVMSLAGQAWNSFTVRIACRRVTGISSIAYLFSSCGVLTGLDWAEPSCLR